MRDEWKDRAFTERWDSADVLRTNPDRLEQLDILVSLLAEECRPGDTILDLGCGSGLVEEAIFRRMPDARVVGIDFSPAMMEKARARLAIHRARFTPVLGDFSDLAALDLPEFRYRCAICVQALHEVPHEVKRGVFAFVRERLAAEGMFYVLDRLTYDADGLGAAYRALWGRLSRKAGTPEPMTFNDYHALYSRKEDHVAGLEDYLAWLREAGFRAACLYLHFNRALFVAR